MSVNMAEHMQAQHFGRKLVAVLVLRSDPELGSMLILGKAIVCIAF